MEWFSQPIIRGGLGIFTLLGICWLFSLKRRRVNWLLVAAGIGLQVGVALLVLKVGWVATALEGVSHFFLFLLQFSEEGSIFLFGETLVQDPSFGASFAFKVLPSIVFFSAFASMLYYLGVLQKIVLLFAWVMNRSMRLSGAESVSAAANIFIGQTEAPLMVKPYLERMTRSEILCLMTGGMATIAGAVLVAYMEFLGGSDPEMKVAVGKRLLMASIMAAPGAIVCAKILLPETREVQRNLHIPRADIGTNLVDAITRGTTQGVKLAVNVGAILLVFKALISLGNFVVFDGVGTWTGLNEIIQAKTDGAYEGLTLQFVFGLFFAPIAWVIGVEPGSLLFAGQLLGEKLVLNEFIAYISLSEMLQEGIIVEQKTIVICTFALCGFANLSSMGIQIGGISVLAPGQRKNLARLAPRALIGGTIASLLSACIAGALIG